MISLYVLCLFGKKDKSENETKKPDPSTCGYYKEEITHNDFMLLPKEKLLSVTHVLLEKSVAPTTTDGQNVPRGYFLITNGRLFFLCEDMGESDIKNMSKHFSQFLLNQVVGNIAGSFIPLVPDIKFTKDSQDITKETLLPTWIDQKRSFVAPIHNLKCERIHTTFNRGYNKNFVRFTIPTTHNMTIYYTMYLKNLLTSWEYFDSHELTKSLEQNNIEITRKKWDDDELSRL